MHQFTLEVDFAMNRVTVRWQGREAVFAIGILESGARRPMARRELVEQFLHRHLKMGDKEVPGKIVDMIVALGGY